MQIRKPRCEQAQTEALKGTGGTIHKSGVVFICSPGPTVVGLLSRSLRTVPEVQGLSPGGDIAHHELVRKGEEKRRAEVRKDAEGDVGLDSDAPAWSAVGVHPRRRPRQGAESEGGIED